MFESVPKIIHLTTCVLYKIVVLILKLLDLVMYDKKMIDQVHFVAPKACVFCVYNK